MTPPLDPAGLIALLIWGTLVGVDLVSLPQMMIARPIVAGTIAGALLGDLTAGLTLGLIFELLQYDILPVGAVRYPEYGPAVVAAVATAHASAGMLGVGLGALVGLVTGLLGGVSIHLLRRWNSVVVHRAAPLLETGDTAALVRVHLGALARDAARALLVTALGLALALAARPLLASDFTLRDATLLTV
ncbi:MAG: PTS sugar transporter subunit IIC, partial [Gemmatimonadales bacterium]